ncbi:(2Fe-2S)-binding protein [Variovorax sp. NFACC27]|uniref:(2Fe-2S)-binding protein n=1 Tax=unclassified Variovorax TaxID=663243 RepID=UPI000894B6DE|nr:putative molibdopterin-dependent oxidoreductase YjgC [Variovorax paradoxus]SEF22659.1 2Fe-2S iron-sulfur cluster binding domain-containing protein [Variovorax sp. NFACC28]SEG00225.1 2Fe-2S iron-sulfur cluster binding domain-containing protein [Variovorax sp. NFACC29]SFB95328.1 2Fe-2S iron-sulfur cluster binding domain-containing protein [Variovorax sp. NFACC26]SFF81006.1 2Fe-2S iron-sulfur cluster binding domain-containing protein [Variovorax sp. NFACC27]
MSAHTLLNIDGHLVRVQAGTSVAAALRVAGGMGVARTSVSGQQRAPFCGMGVCQECRVLIDGRRRLACQTVCTEGMRVETSE